MSRLIEINAGEKFGKLTVVKRVVKDNTKSTKAFWECVCECGNTVITNGTALRRGDTVQCKRCAHEQLGLKRRRNIVGQTFGLLTVESVDYSTSDGSGRKRTYCDCTCVCGNKVRMSLDTLSSPGLHSCGCGRKITAAKNSKNIIGQKFGRLTVVEEFCECTPREVLCRCECGNEIRVSKTDVMFSHTKSCGCLRKDRITEANEKNWSGFINDYGIELIEKSYKNSHGTWIWRAKCPCCNEMFNVLPINVTSNKYTSCGCRNKSSGECLIESILLENNIKYETQYRFDDCRDIYSLPFDFALFINGTIILLEYDGKQHFCSIDFYGGEDAFNKRLLHDKIKNDYCEERGIKLIRIPYTYEAKKIREVIMDLI